MAMRLLTTFFARAHLSNLTIEISSLSKELVSDDLRRSTVELFTNELSTIIVGPSLFLVVGLAATAFLFKRLLNYFQIEGPFSAILVLMATLLMINFALHIHLASWNIWDVSPVVDGLQFGQTSLSTENVIRQTTQPLNLSKYLAQQELTSVLMGFSLVWIRFLFAGSGNITTGKVSRSWGFGFIASALFLFISGISGISTVFYVALQFILGALTLSLAYQTGVRPDRNTVSKITPWAYSLAGTILILCLIGAIFSLATVLNISPIIQTISSIVGPIISQILIWIFTPLFWIFQMLLDLIGPADSQYISQDQCTELLKAANEATRRGDTVLAYQLNTEYQTCLAPAPLTEGGAETSDLPAWVGTSVKAFGLFVGGYLLYRLTLFIVGLRRTSTNDEDDDAERFTSSSEGSTLSDLLNALLPGRERKSRDWIDKHKIYQLWDRLEQSGTSRGMPRFVNQTAFEYAAEHEKRLETPALTIALMFDKARYGREYPDSDEVMSAQVKLELWEDQMPATDALREFVHAARQPEDIEKDRWLETLANELTQQQEQERDQRVISDDPDALPY
ncbi:MAG TPA: DUF4129 domain-containing protein [Dehalococcoidia bacterium]|nr:DUF4129 domain-containing protein [Dehalococcoidia bacterium]